MTTQTSTTKRPEVTKQGYDLIAEMHNSILSGATEKPKWYFVRDAKGARFFAKDPRFFAKDSRFTGPENKRDIYNKSAKFISDCDVDEYNRYIKNDMEIMEIMKKIYPDNQCIEKASNKWAKLKSSSFNYQEEIATKEENNDINLYADIRIDELQKKYVGLTDTEFIGKFLFAQWIVNKYSKPITNTLETKVPETKVSEPKVPETKVPETIPIKVDTSEIENIKKILLSAMGAYPNSFSKLNKPIAHVVEKPQCMFSGSMCPDIQDQFNKYVKFMETCSVTEYDNYVYSLESIMIWTASPIAHYRDWVEHRINEWVKMVNLLLGDYFKPSIVEYQALIQYIAQHGPEIQRRYLGMTDKTFLGKIVFVEFYVKRYSKIQPKKYVGLKYNLFEDFNPLPTARLLSNMGKLLIAEINRKNKLEVSADQVIFQTKMQEIKRKFTRLTNDFNEPNPEDLIDVSSLKQMCVGDEFKVQKPLPVYLDEPKNTEEISVGKMKELRGNDDSGIRKTKFTMNTTAEELEVEFNTYIFNRKHLPELQNEFPGLKYDQYIAILKAKKLGIDRKIADIKIQLDITKKEIYNIRNTYYDYYEKRISELKLVYPELSLFLYHNMLRASWSKVYEPQVDELILKIQKLTAEFEALSK